MTRNSQAPETSPRFIPLMVRIVTPLNIVIVAIAIVGVFLLTSSLTQNVDAVEQNLIVQTALQVTEASQDQYNNLLQEAQRIAFTQGVSDATRAGEAEQLQQVLEPLAVSASLDSVIILDTTGREVIGLLLDVEANDYTLSRQTNLSDEALVQSILNDGEVNAVGLLQTPNGMMLYVASVIRGDESVAGVMLTGRYLNSVLDAIQVNVLAEVSTYSVNATLLDTTLVVEDSNLPALALDQTVIEQALSNSNQVTLASGLSVNGEGYRVAIMPFSVGETTLGVLSVLMQDNVAMATSGGRQISALLMAVIAGMVSLIAATSIKRFTNRVEEVTATVDALSRGEDARVDMPATDELGVMAMAVNRYADVVKYREDQFREDLHRFRRERDYLLLAFEAVPEGIVVQDTDGRVLLMNEIARDLLGSQRVYRSAGIHELTDLVNDKLGANIAPGLYSLGHPEQIALDEKVLMAQASAIVVSNGQRLGTVVLLRDITEDIKFDRAQEQILAQISNDVQVSLQDTSRRAMQSRDELVRHMARDVAKHASTLQSMIMEMRELTRYSTQLTKRIQRPLSLETLVWAVANDWRQIAISNDLQLSVILEQRGIFILGDEQRLRYALGNFIDNAIKYNQNDGKMSIEVRGEVNGMARIRIRDSGVGILEEDVAHLFVRYYRGHPTKDNGEMIRVPGMGQGLFDAQQIIVAHGGTINIKSKVGVGTAVYIELPTTAESAYQLPMIEDDVMEGETMLIPDDVDVHTFWEQDEL